MIAVESGIYMQALGLVRISKKHNLVEISFFLKQSVNNGVGSYTSTSKVFFFQTPQN